MERRGYRATGATGTLAFAHRLESLIKKDMAEQNEEKKYAATYDGGVKENDIQQWKSRYGKVIRIDVVDGDELHIGYFHRPKLDTMSAVSKIGKTDEVKSAEVMFDNCWLGGSKALREDTILFLETTKQLGSMFNRCMSSLKNL